MECGERGSDTFEVKVCCFFLVDECEELCGFFACLDEDVGCGAG